MAESMIRWFRDVSLDDLPQVGGKNASLGELIRLEGVKVPNGFAITTEAWESFMTPLKPRIAEHLARNKASLVGGEKSPEQIRQALEGFLRGLVADTGLGAGASAQLVEDSSQPSGLRANLSLRTGRGVLNGIEINLSVGV